MNHNDIEKIHAILISLSSSQRKQLIAEVRRQGIPLRDIQPYAYAEAPGIPHIFLYFDDDKTPHPYFSVEKEIWDTIYNNIINL